MFCGNGMETVMVMMGRVATHLLVLGVLEELADVFTSEDTGLTVSGCSEVVGLWGVERLGGERRTGTILRAPEADIVSRW